APPRLTLLYTVGERALALAEHIGAHVGNLSAESLLIKDQEPRVVGAHGLSEPIVGQDGHVGIPGVEVKGARAAEGRLAALVGLADVPGDAALVDWFRHDFGPAAPDPVLVLQSLHD